MKHVWSGWPGAYCLKCGASDPLELALADNWYDPATKEFDTAEHQEMVRLANICPVDFYSECGQCMSILKNPQGDSK